MSFGTNTGFGFGQSNNQSSGTGFGGFGSNTATNTGFGTSTSNTGFGSTTASSNPFSTSGFGSNTGGGFGSSNNTTSLFGQNKPAFGSTNTSSAPSLFGNNTASAGFGSTGGGFSTNTSTGFGAATNNTGSAFSFGTQTNKPAFGSNTGSTLFGQGGSGTTGGFGSNNNAFSSASGTALNQGVPPSEGTGATPFQPTNEKEPNGGNISYQSISFQQPYQKYSFEEMRLADYAAGRRFGTGSGFGTSNFSGFGTSSNTGFGTTNSNPFGAASSSSTPFGSTQTSGLGSGGLFGNKPSTSLFGSQSTSASTGGLFGTSNTTTTPFGASSGTGFGANSTTSLFGNNQNQNKPAGSLFGNTGANTSTGFGFGGNSNTTTNVNPFGGSSGGSLFGNNNTQSQGTSLFGQNQNQNQQKPLFGSSFGANTTQSQPPTGLFGSTGPTNTSTGLFGNNSGTQSQGGLFGGGSSNQTSTLFGGNSNTTQKPLFGGSSTNTGPGLFGNAPSQPANTGLFGNNNQQQNQTQQGPSLFGGNNTASSGIFGNSNANKPGSFFGNSTGNASQGPSLFGNNNNSNSGLFSGSQSTQNTPQQSGSLHASLLDGNPYGQSSIWTGLPSATPQNSGPLATPLTASQRLKESQAKPPPSLRFSGTRYMTPPRRQGYGLTYSPTSSAGSTPGGGSLSTSMYGRAFTGGSFGKVIGKSFSASNLRQQFSTDGESVLSPGAFAPGSSRYSSGSIRRLTIDKNVKVDLFGRSTQPALPAPTSAKDAPTTNGETAPAEQPNKLKKRVSFDKDITGGETNGHLNGESGALVSTETDEQDPPVEETRFSRSARRNTNTNGTSSAPPEMEHVRGNELAVVPEDRESDDVGSKMRLPTDASPTPDPKPGEYWMKPSRAEISKMSREKLQNYRGFQVGRHGCGSVTFDGLVDLTTIPLDDLYGKLIDIELRSITVYPEASTKPPPGKGLNVPSTLRLENSWPRNRKTNAPSSATSGPLFEKHIKRLRNTTNTEFVGYDVQTGVWIFRVPHFTRYGLDYDDDDDDDESALSSLQETPAGPTPRLASSTLSTMEVDDALPDDSSPEDDTFAFKQKFVPGGYNRQSVVEYDHEQSFLGDSSAAATSGSEHSHVSDQDESDDEVNMAGSFPLNDGGAELHAESPMRQSLMAGHQPWGTPGRPLIDLDDDWAEQLQRTISPRKQNREALREVQSNVLLDRSQQPLKRPQSSNKTEFRTSIDVMNSLFGKHEERMALSRAQEQGGSGFEWPYPKRAKTFDSTPTDTDTANQSLKPKWTPTGHLLYAQSGLPPTAHATSEWQDVRLVAGEGRDVTESILKGTDKDPFLDDEMAWRTSTQISVIDGVPVAKHKNVPFSTFCDRVAERKTGSIVAPGGEREVYQLAHVLFDEYEDEFCTGLTSQQKKQFGHRIRKDRVTDYWDLLVGRRHYKDIAEAEKRSLEEAALWYLTVHDIAGACNCLMKAKDYHLATLVAQIDQADKVFQEDIKSQIEAWREQSIIPEMSEPIRALYEILAGNTTISKGKSDGPAEDRASTFTISERFGFDWMQAFALCLWYGEHKHGSIEDAVQEFEGKLDERLESAYPYPDTRQEHSAGDANSTLVERRPESPLWVLLKLYAARRGTGQKPPILPQALAPLTTPFDARASFQLHHSLAAHIPHVRVDTARADVLAADLAFQLSAADFYIGAAYALMHLSHASERKAAIKDLLARHAAGLPGVFLTSSTSIDASNIDPAAAAQWQLLTQELKIPTEWICEAKAQYARSQNQSLDELHYLIAADLWSQAHTCLCRRVAPRAVIDEDWVRLSEILGKFGEKPEEKVGEAWSAGGGIYADFMRLVAPISKEKGKREKFSEGHGHGHGHGSAGLVHRLQAALAEMGARFKKRTGGLWADGSEELEERVACKEMGRLVAEAIVADGEVQRKTILDLPLTADARLNQTRELSVGYYRAAMAAAK